MPKEGLLGKDIRKGALVWLTPRNGRLRPTYPGVITWVNHKTWKFRVLALHYRSKEREYTYLGIMDPKHPFSMHLAEKKAVGKYLRDRVEHLRRTYSIAREITQSARKQYVGWRGVRGRIRKIVGVSI